MDVFETIVKNFPIEDVDVDGNISWNFNGIVELIPEEYRPLAELYVPALLTMTGQEINRFREDLKQGEILRAQRELRKNLTAEELVEEKRELTNLMRQLAENSHNDLLKRKRFLDASLRIALFSALRIV